MKDEIDSIKNGQTIRLSPEQAKAFQPNPAETAKLARMESDATLASTAPLPGPLRDAFAADPRTFFGVTLQPITATHIAALVKSKNPFIDALRYGMAAAQVTDPAEKARLSAAAENLDVQPDDLFEVLQIFATTPASIRSMPSTPSIRDQATALMDKFPPIIPDQLSAVLASHYFESFKTALNFQQTESPNDRAKKKSPDAPLSATDSASSSTPSQP